MQMKNNLPDIKGFLKIENLKNDKQFVVFMICLLIATILWFLNALGKDYSAVVSYPVKYVNAPKNQFVSNELPSNLELKVEAHGFTLLRHKLSLSFSPLVLNINNITKNVNRVDGKYVIKTSDLLNRISEQVSKEMSIQEIQPEYFTIVLDSLLTKSVLVKPDVQLEFLPQYKLKGRIIVKPERVLITGPAALVDSIKFLATENKKLEKLDVDIEKNISVVHPENTEINPEKVSLKIAVEKYTEKELKIPVQIKNKPENVKIKYFPSEIKISFMIGLSEFESITASQFSAFIDYNEVNSQTTTLEVKIENKPSYIELLRISPETVEYLIETE